MQRPHCPYPKVRRSKPVGGGRRGRGGRGGVREVSVDVCQQVAHHGWHSRTHVLSRQTGEMPTERRKKAHVSRNRWPQCFVQISSNLVIGWSLLQKQWNRDKDDALQCCILTFSRLNLMFQTIACGGRGSVWIVYCAVHVIKRNLQSPQMSKSKAERRLRRDRLALGMLRSPI